MRRSVRSASLFLLLALPSFAQPAHLVRDIEPATLGGQGSFPQQLGRCGPRLCFAATTRLTGMELWWTDGTRTELVKDLHPGFGDGLQYVEQTGPEPVSVPPALGSAGGLTYFRGRSDDGSGLELWVSDGTESGTRPLGRTRKDQPWYPERFTDLNGTIYFVAWTVAGQALWKSDGTEEGTVPVSAGNLFFSSELLSANGALFFTIREDDGSTGLWTTGGAAPILLGRFPTEASFYAGARSLAAAPGLVYFGGYSVAEGWELWKTDGTPAGTVLVRDLVPGPGHSYATPLAAVGSTLFFLASENGVNQALWKTDGSAAGTSLVKSFGPDPYGGFTAAVSFGGFLWFSANDGVSGMELWKSDGTPQGTALVVDATPGPDGTYYPVPFVAGRRLYFFAHGLWTSDGTTAGTVRLADGFAPDMSFAEMGGFVYLAMDDGIHGAELWRTDGTVRRTTLVADIEPGILGIGSEPKGLVDAGGTLYFGASDMVNGSALWRSDGSPAGTYSVFDPWTGPYQSFPATVALGSKVVFLLGDSGASPMLWVSDGTAKGTVALRTFTGNRIESLSPLGGRCYLLVTGAGPPALWSTDGTPRGTRLAVSLPPTPPGGPGVRLLFEAGGLLWLTVGGAELWASDGTPDRTWRVHDLPAGKGVNVSAHASLPGALLYAVTFPSGDAQLWRTNGKTEGTWLVADHSAPLSMASAGDFAYFSDRLRPGLWRTDGTSRGTVSLSSVRANQVLAAGGTVFFGGSTTESGTELWASDGTSEGTRLVKEIVPGRNGSDPHDLTAAAGTLFFTATDPLHGEELWTSDGTSEGTHLVQDIAAGSLSSLPRRLTVSGGNLFFTADDGDHGRELWAIPLLSPAASAAPR